MNTDKDQAIVFYEPANGTGVRGIVIHDEGSEIPEVLRNRFQGGYKKLTEWIENGVSGGGYHTPEDVITFVNPGDSFEEEFQALNEIDIALSPVNQIYRINRNGTITRVQAHLKVEFMKVEEQ